MSGCLVERVGDHRQDLAGRHGQDVAQPAGDRLAVRQQVAAAGLQPPVAVLERQVEHVAGRADAEPAERGAAGRDGEEPVQDQQALARLGRRGDDAEPGGHQSRHGVAQRRELLAVEPCPVPQLVLNTTVRTVRSVIIRWSGGRIF